MQIRVADSRVLDVNQNLSSVELLRRVYIPDRDFTSLLFDDGGFVLLWDLRSRHDVLVLELGGARLIEIHR